MRGCQRKQPSAALDRQQTETCIYGLCLFNQLVWNCLSSHFTWRRKMEIAELAKFALSFLYLDTPAVKGMADMRPSMQQSCHIKTLLHNGNSVIICSITRCSEFICSVNHIRTRVLNLLAPMPLPKKNIILPNKIFLEPIITYENI